MFLATISSSSLKEIVDALNVVSDNYIIIDVSKENMKTRLIDCANVLMLNATIPAESFSKYPMDCEQFQMAPELYRISKFLDSVDDRGRNEETIYLEYNPDEYTLYLTSKYMSTLQKYISPSRVRGSPKLLNLDWAGRATIDAEDFVRAVKAMSTTATVEGADGCDYVELSISPLHTMGTEAKFNMDAKFDDGKKGNDELGFEKLNMQGQLISTSKEVKSKFSIDYLMDMVPTIEKVEKIDILLGTDIPVKFKFTLPKSRTLMEYTYACRAEQPGQA